MVSEHMERYSLQFDMCRRKHLTSFGLVSLVYAAKLKPHIICTTHQLKDDFVQNTFSSLTNVHA